MSHFHSTNKSSFHNQHNQKQSLLTKRLHRDDDQEDSGKKKSMGDLPNREMLTRAKKVIYWKKYI